MGNKFVRILLIIFGIVGIGWLLTFRVYPWVYVKYFLKPVEHKATEKDVLEAPTWYPTMAAMITPPDVYCVVDGIRYEERDKVPSEPTVKCQECFCYSGSIFCQRVSEDCQE